MFAILQKKSLQYITINKINLFERDKNFSSLVIICNKLSVNMDKFLDEYLSSLTKMSCIIFFKARLANNY